MANRSRRDSITMQNSSILSLEELPNEVMSSVLAFIGPTSPSLLSLAQANKRFKKLMYRIGQQMLDRARHLNEGNRGDQGMSPLSSICLFVKHANPFQTVYEKALNLQSTLRVGGFKTGQELDQALDQALDILQTSSQLCSSLKGAFVAKMRELEELLLRVCGRAGAMGFKSSKLRVQMIRLLQLSQDCVEHDRNQLLAMEATERSRLDKSKLVIQSVIARDFQAAKQCQGRGITTPPKMSSATTMAMKHLTSFPGDCQTEVKNQLEGVRRICLFIGALKRYREEVTTGSGSTDDGLRSKGKRRKIVLS